MMRHPRRRRNPIPLLLLPLLAIGGVALVAATRSRGQDCRDVVLKYGAWQEGTGPALAEAEMALFRSCVNTGGQPPAFGPPVVPPGLIFPEPARPPTEAELCDKYRRFFQQMTGSFE